MLTLITFFVSVGTAVLGHYAFDSLDDSVYFYVLAILLGLYNIAGAVERRKGE